MRKTGLSFLLTASLLISLGVNSVAANANANANANSASKKASKVNEVGSEKNGKASKVNKVGSEKNGVDDKANAPASEKVNDKKESKSPINSTSSGPGKSPADSNSNSNSKENPGQDKKAENSAKNDSKVDTLKDGESRTFIIKFKDSASLAAESNALRGQKVKIGRSFNNVFKGLTANLNSKQLAALAKNPNVEIIEEDLEVRTTAIQNSPTWGLDRIDQRNLPLSQSYEYLKSGSSVTAFIVDTGIRSSHSEFSGRIRSGYSSISDGRGSEDCNGHGTHVAGTVGGTTYGVAKSTLLVPVRVLACDGSGTYSGVIAGLDWIAGTHPQNSPAVVNMSLGGPASSTLDSAVNNVINRGITVVVAAGNSAANACNYSPARVPAAITVTATTSSDQLASYSNAGSCVDILAPGSGITSAWHTSNDAITTLNGTSMASPHVAGVVALALSDGYLSPANLDSQIKSWSTTNLFSRLPAGTPNRFLYSNPTDVVPSPAPELEVPSAPTNVTATALKRSAEVRWKLPDSDGGSPLTKQTISVWSGTQLVRSVNVTSVATSALIRSLNFRVSYTFSITATNFVGDSPASQRSNAITPLR